MVANLIKCWLYSRYLEVEKNGQGEEGADISGMGKRTQTPSSDARCPIYPIYYCSRRDRYLEPINYLQALNYCSHPARTHEDGRKPVISSFIQFSSFKNTASA